MQREDKNEDAAVTTRTIEMTRAVHTLFYADKRRQNYS